MTFFRLAGLTTAAALASSAAWAGCDIPGGDVRVLGNDYGSIQTLVAGAEACAGDGVTVSANLTTEHQSLQVAALTADPAQYTAAVVANSSIVPLLNNDLIRSLDDMVAQYGQDLNRNQMITIDGHVMAVAFQANAQHLYYRSDILEQVGLPVPTTYEEVLTAAQAIRDAGIMQYPFAMNTKVGWNLAEEFVNMYLGEGGQFFEPGSARVSINNAQGVAALTMLRSLMAYSNPDFLTFDSNATQALWESGQIALATLWGSRAAGILDDEGSTEEITSHTMLAAAPTVGGGSIPASTLWWDGITIAAHVPDADAEASFRAFMHAMSADYIAAHNNETVWLAPGYTPTPAAQGVFATANAGALPYPMLPYMGLLHTALGDNLSEFLQGQESAEQALADAEAAYTTAARAQGFLE
ncbi:MAG: extracellular solute-binding protein [Rhodobacteraceae bacterium]|nr:extracellular solute-binding protein [Paracoccaceae bacterium]